MNVFRKKFTEETNLMQENEILVCSSFYSFLSYYFFTNHFPFLHIFSFRFSIPVALCTETLRYICYDTKCIIFSLFNISFTQKNRCNFSRFASTSFFFSLLVFFLVAGGVGAFLVPICFSFFWNFAKTKRVWTNKTWEPRPDHSTF